MEPGNCTPHVRVLQPKKLTDCDADSALRPVHHAVQDRVHVVQRKHLHNRSDLTEVHASKFFGRLVIIGNFETDFSFGERPLSDWNRCKTVVPKPHGF